MAQRILIADDEREIADLIALYLENDGYETVKAYTGARALECIEQSSPDLAILDVMLPDADGFSLLREIRRTCSMPVIMLTARVADGDKILGLTLGADDYITKPFNPLEVIARVKTVLRRCRASEPQCSMEYDIRGLYVNRAGHKCALFGKPVQLTPTEFDILWYLCSNQGRVVPSEELFEAVWKEKYLDNNNTVMAHIARLREKLCEPARNPRFIKTVWGVGYEIE